MIGRWPSLSRQHPSRKRIVWGLNGGRRAVMTGGAVYTGHWPRLAQASTGSMGLWKMGYLSEPCHPVAQASGLS